MLCKNAYNINVTYVTKKVSEASSISGNEKSGLEVVLIHYLYGGINVQKFKNCKS